MYTDWLKSPCSHFEVERKCQHFFILVSLILQLSSLARSQMFFFQPKFSTPLLVLSLPSSLLTSPICHHLLFDTPHPFPSLSSPWHFKIPIMPLLLQYLKMNGGLTTSCQNSEKSNNTRVQCVLHIFIKMYAFTKIENTFTQVWLREYLWLC